MELLNLACYLLEKSSHRFEHFEQTLNIKSFTKALFHVTYIKLAINCVPFRLFSVNVLNNTQFRPTAVMQKDEAVLNVKMNRHPNMYTTNESARVAPFTDRDDIGLCELVTHITCVYSACVPPI